MNKYVWIMVLAIVMFIFSPRRNSDPLGATVIALASGAFLVIVLLIFDFVITPIKKKFAAKASEKLILRREMPEISIAAADGNDQRISELLSAGANVDQPDAKGGTA